MAGGKNDKARADDDGERTEAERQGEVSVWARAFGVSSDEMSGAADHDRPEAEEAQAEQAEKEAARRPPSR